MADDRKTGLDVRKTSIEERAGEEREKLERMDREARDLDRRETAVGSAPEPAKPGHGKDEVEEAGEDSFPASDPPSYTPVSGTTQPNDKVLKRRRALPPQQ